MRAFDKLRLSGIWVGVLVLLAGCEKSFDDRYADAEKKLREQAVSIDKELAAKASEAVQGGAELGDPQELVCPAITEGWLEFIDTHNVVLWRLDVRKDGTLRWGNQPLARDRLADRLLKAHEGMTPLPVLQVHLEKGVDCNFVREIRDEVRQNFPCDTHRCVVPPPDPPRSGERHSGPNIASGRTT